MKSCVCSGVLFLLASTTSTQAWTIPLVSASGSKEVMYQTASSSVTAAVFRGVAVVALVAATATSPLAAAAAADPFPGNYADPVHPNCKREITTIPGSTTSVRVAGTDGSPACPPDGSGTPWTLSGTILDDSTILVDFSPKGGPSNLKGIYDTSSVPSGIQWPDGNKWSKLGE